MRTRGGRGVKKAEKSAYVLNGSPLMVTVPSISVTSIEQFYCSFLYNILLWVRPRRSVTKSAAATVGGKRMDMDREGGHH